MKQKQKDLEKEKKIDEINICKDSGKSMKDCINDKKDADKNKSDDLNITEIAKMDIIDYEQQIFMNCMNDCKSENKTKNCKKTCLQDSGADSKSEAKLVMKMEKEAGKENIKKCEENGSDIKGCLQAEFEKNPEAKKQVIGSVKE